MRIYRNTPRCRSEAGRFAEGSGSGLPLTFWDGMTGNGKPGDWFPRFGPALSGGLRDWGGRPRRRGPAGRASTYVLLFLGLFLVSTLSPGSLSAVPRPPSLCQASGSCGTPAVSTVPPPLHGLVTSCKSASVCAFSFNTSAGTGTASGSPPSMSLQLPGEGVVSTGLSYSTYIQKLTGTYTYWTVGNFAGTDANTGKIVYGTTNTNYTITCVGHSGRGGGCGYQYKTDNGTIVVFFTNAEQTATSVSCTPSTLAAGNSTLCTVTVSDTANSSATPVGNVSLSQAYGSTIGFANGGLCRLASGSCSVRYSAPDEQLGTVPITASYPGTPSFYASSGRTSVYVTTSGSGGDGGGGPANVTFNAAGLPSGVPWTVSFAGLNITSTNGSIAFSVQNGSYAFTVATAPGFSISPRAGNVTVTGSDLNVSVVFTPRTFGVTFHEAGLPTNKAWAVTLGGSTVRGTSSLASFSLGNGSFAYLVRGPAGFRVVGSAPVGSVVVNGGAVNVSVNFSAGRTYTLGFGERGLPRGTSWCVSVGGLVCSSGASLRLANLTPAIYPYAVQPLPGQVITARLGGAPQPIQGNLSLLSHSLRIGLRFAYPYTLTFTETGLPAGTTWSVTVRGVSTSSATDTLSFEVTNGTYRYRVGAEAGYHILRSPVRAVVAGGPCNVTITFVSVAAAPAPGVPRGSWGFPAAWELAVVRSFGAGPILDW